MRRPLGARLVVAAFAASGCAGDAHVDQDADGVAHVNVGMLPIANVAPLYLGTGSPAASASGASCCPPPRREPFASVDAQTRAELEDLVLNLHGEFSVTIVFVTHDIDEAVYLGQRVVVLTPSPTRVQEELVVDLPSPRDQVETKELPAFTQLRAHVYRSIRKRDATEPVAS